MKEQKQKNNIGGWVLYRLGDDDETYGKDAGKPIITTEDGEIEICGPIHSEEAAQLMVTAPKLLDALEDFVQWAQLHGLDVDWIPLPELERPGFVAGRIEEIPVVAQARAIIAEAKGALGWHRSLPGILRDSQPADGEEHGREGGGMKPVTCRACGHSWPRDPALEVPCPDCFAAVGSACRRPSGHGCDIHSARDQLAMDRGFLTPCPVSAKAPVPDQMDLFTKE